MLQQGSSDALERGLYVVGWAKRGPTGIIGACFSKPLLGAGKSALLAVLC